MLENILRSILLPPLKIFFTLTGQRDRMANVLDRYKKMGIPTVKFNHALTLLVRVNSDVDWDNKKIATLECERFLNHIENGALQLARTSDAVPDWKALHNKVLDIAIDGFQQNIANQ